MLSRQCQRRCTLRRPRPAMMTVCFCAWASALLPLLLAAPGQAGGGRWVQRGEAAEDLPAGVSSFGPAWPAQDSSQYSPWLVHLGGRLVMYYCKNIQMNQSGIAINRDRVHRVERAPNGTWGPSTVAVEGTNTTAPDDLSCSPGVATVREQHHMYYVGAARAEGMTLYLLHAVSADSSGLSWTRRGLVGGSWPQPFPGYFETPTPIYDETTQQLSLYIPATVSSGKGSGVFVSRSLSTDMHEFTAPTLLPSSPAGAQAGRLVLPPPACMASATAANAALLYIYSISIKGAPPDSVSIASGHSLQSLGAGLELFRASGQRGAWDADRVWSPTAIWVPSRRGAAGGTHAVECNLVVYYAGNVGTYGWWGANTSIGHRQFEWTQH